MKTVVRVFLIVAVLGMVGNAFADGGSTSTGGGQTTDGVRLKGG